MNQMNQTNDTNDTDRIKIHIQTHNETQMKTPDPNEEQKNRMR